MAANKHARKSFEERLEKTQNPLLKRLFSIIIEKRTNLCLSAKFYSNEEALDFVDHIGPHICILKVRIRGFGSKHCDAFVTSLLEKRKKHNFLILEDREFNDLAATVCGQYKGFYVDYANIVTVHSNDSTFKAINEVIRSSNLPEDDVRGCLAICQFGYEKPEASDPNKRLEIATRNSPLCCGIIAQKLRVADPYNMIKATPGVHLSKSGDGLNQNYNDPEKVVAAGADIIIVGRGIIATHREEWLDTTLRYKEAAYQAYLEDLNHGRISYADRFEKTKNPILKKLFKIIVDKKSTLCVAADFGTFGEILDFIDQVGDHICILKVQLERFGRENCDSFKTNLMDRKKKHNFLLFEDCKMDYDADTIRDIYEGFYIECSDIITIHPSDANFEAVEKTIRSANLPEHEPRGCFALCELSYEKLEATSPIGRYETAKQNTPLCCGIVARDLPVSDLYNLIKVSPQMDLTVYDDRRTCGIATDGVDIFSFHIDSSKVDWFSRGFAKLDWYDYIVDRKESFYQAYLDSLNDY